MRDFLLFEEARVASSVRSKFFASERRLEVEIETVTPRLAAMKDATKPAETASLCPSLAVPQSFDGEGVESVTIDDKAISLRKLGRSGDGFYHIVSMPCGTHKVHVIYAGQAIGPIEE